MKIKKGDTVKIIAGKDCGKTGKVTHVFPKEGRIVVDGVSVRKKHARPKKQGQKGQVIQMPTPINVSNAMVVCAACAKPVRIASKIAGVKKVRVCKKCGAEL